MKQPCVRRARRLCRSAELRVALRERCRRLKELEADLEAADNDNLPLVARAPGTSRLAALVAASGIEDEEEGV